MSTMTAAAPGRSPIRWPPRWRFPMPSLWAAAVLFWSAAALAGGPAPAPAVSGPVQAGPASPGPAAVAAAVMRGDPAEVVALLEEVADPRVRERFQDGALSIAATEGQRAVVEALLARGADPNFKDADGRTALSRALRQTDPGFLVVLLEHGADLKASVEANRFDVLSGAAGASPAVLGWLLEHGIDPNLDHAGTTLLKQAVWLGKRENVELLLAKGARDQADGGALQEALSKADLPIVRTLLAHGAKAAPLAPHPDPWNTLVLAAVQGPEALDAALRDPDVAAHLGGGQGRRPLLVRAAGFGEVGLVDRLLAWGADVNTQDSQGRTALMDALSHGQDAVVKTLLAHGAAVDAKDSDGRTALMDAVSHGQDAVVETLLAHGAAVDAKDRQGRSALLDAVLQGRDALVGTLLAHGADAQTADQDGCTLLLHAVRQRRFALAEALLARGANINVGGGLGLDLDPEQVRWLLGHGARLDALAATGQVSVFEPPGTLFDQLILAGAAFDPRGAAGRIALLRAAARGDLAAVKRLLDQGVDVNAGYGPDPRGRYPVPGGGWGLTQDQTGVRPSAGGTALTLAAEQGDLTLVRMLLGRGAAVDARGTEGRTALDTAVRRGDGAMARALSARGTGPGAQGLASPAGLVAAVRAGDRDGVQTLLAGGVEINAPAPDGETALTAAVKQGDPDLVRGLLGHGADPNVRSPGHRTALEVALYDDRRALVPILLAAGARPNDWSLEPPLLDAVRQGDRETVEALLDQGADPEPERGAGGAVLEVPLSVAAAAGRTELVAALIDHGARLGPEALAAAVIASREALVRLLIGRGADVNARIERTPGLRVRDRCDNEIDFDQAGYPAAATPRVLNLPRPDGKGVVRLFDCSHPPLIPGVPGVLSIAAAQGNAPLVQLLLEAGARIEARDAAGRTALWFAIEYDQPAAVPLLLAHGARVAALDAERALRVAVRDGQNELLQALLDGGVDVAGLGAGALFEAAQAGDVAHVGLLLDRGADVHAAPWTHPGSALCFALASRHTEVVRLLLAKGADPNCRVNGSSLMVPNAARMPGPKPTGRQSLALSDDLRSPPWERMDLESARLLIEHGVDLEARDPWGRTALMRALGGRRPEVVALLIERGAEVGARTADGRTTALSLARELGDRALIDLLTAAGARD